MSTDDKGWGVMLDEMVASGELTKTKCRRCGKLGFYQSDLGKPDICADCIQGLTNSVMQSNVRMGNA